MAMIGQKYIVSISAAQTRRPITTFLNRTKMTYLRKSKNWKPSYLKQSQISYKALETNNNRGLW